MRTNVKAALVLLVLAVASLVAVAALTRADASAVTCPGPSGYANVRDFGAMGNGVADDTAAIQAAISCYAAPGGAVYIPAGVYRLTSHLYPQKSTRIIGAGSGGQSADAQTFAATTLDFRSVLGGHAVRGADNSAGWGIEGVFLWGPKDNEVVSHEQNGAAIYTGGYSTRVTVRDVVVKGFNNGLVTWQTSDVLVDSSLFVLQRTHAVAVIESQGVRILNTGLGNAHPSGEPEGVWHEANLFVRNSYNVLVSGSAIDEAFGAGVASVYVRDSNWVTIRDTEVYATNQGHGVRLVNVTNGTLENVMASTYHPPSVTEVWIEGGQTNSLHRVTTRGGNASILDSGTGTLRSMVNGLP